MKAVLDSSVLVSAFLSPNGTPAALLARAREGAFSLCLSREILAESAAALLRKIHRSRRESTLDEVAEFWVVLTLLAERIEGDLPEIRAVPADSKDDMVVATAVAAGADYLVTGDRRHLLPLGTYQGIQIITPREFLDLMARSDPGHWVIT
jgi:uncharacterized protein